MKDYYTKSIKALQLAGMSKRTQQCYTRSVRMLVQHYDKSPELITEDELQEYFLHRLNVSKWSSNTMKICYSGIKFFLSTFCSANGTSLTFFGLRRKRSYHVF